MNGVQYEQTIAEDGLPYIRAVDNQQFYIRQNPVSAGFINRMGAAAMPPGQQLNGSIVLPTNDDTSTPTSVTTSLSATKQNRAKLAFNRKYLLSWYNGIPRLILTVSFCSFLLKLFISN